MTKKKFELNTEEKARARGANARRNRKPPNARTVANVRSAEHTPGRLNISREAVADLSAAFGYPAQEKTLALIRDPRHNPIPFGTAQDSADESIAHYVDKLMKEIQ